MEFEWKDIEKKLEEDEFKKEKASEAGKAQGAGQQGAAASGAAGQSHEWKSIGLAAIGYETWNELAVGKGYDAVSDAQKAFLDRHTAKLEEKWLKNVELLPEIEAGLSHVVVYLPKWVKGQKGKAEAGNEARQ